MGGGAVIDAAKNLIQKPLDTATAAADKAEGMVGSVTDAATAGAKKVASAVGGAFDDSGTQTDQAFVARKQQDADTQLATAYLAAHPERAQALGIQPISTGPTAKPATAQPAADGSTPSTGDYQGTDLFGNPVTLTSAQRKEATSGAVTGLDQPFAQQHPNVATVHNLLPLIGLALGVGKLSANLYRAGAEGVAAAGGASSAANVTDITKDSPAALAKTSERFQEILNHPDTTPELKTAIQSLRPAIRDPETGETYLANDPTAKNHFQVFGDLPQEVADKESLDTGFVGPENEYMTRDQAQNYLVAAQATGTAPPRPVSGEIMEGPPGASATAKVVSGGEAVTTAGAAGGEGTPPPIPEEHATPLAAAQTLAENQVEALKKMKIGERVAHELDHPELARIVPEAETIAAGKAQGLTMAHLGGQQLTEPEMARAAAAMTSTVHDETMELRTQAMDILQRKSAGEDVTADEQAWTNRVSALAPQAARVAGMRTGAGRALQILDPLKPENLRIQAVNRFALEAGDAQTHEDLLQMFTKATDPAAISRQLGAMSDTLEQGGSIKGAIGEYWMNSLLSKPRTMVKKGLGDLTSWALEMPTRALATRIPAWGKGAPVAVGEANALAHGSIESFGDALRIAGQTFKGQQSSIDAFGGEGSFEGTGRAPQITGALLPDGTPDIMKSGVDLLGSAIRLPSRGIGAVHDFSRLINYRGEIHALALRGATQEAAQQGLEGEAAGNFISGRAAELANDPTAEMHQAALAAANQRTYSAPLGPIAEKFNQFLDSLPAGLGRLAFPFRRVPVNIEKYAIGYSPAALATKTFWNAMGAGGADGQMALAKLGIGTGFILTMLRAAQDNFITGGGPQDPKQRRDLIATGWKPYAFHVGDNYYTYGSVEPGSTPLGIAADFHDVYADSHGPMLDKATNALVVAMGRNATRQSYVQTAVNFGSLMDDLRTGTDWQEAISKFGGKELSGVIPAFVQGEATREDPVLRDARGMVDEMKARTPGYSKTLPPHRDLFGNSIPLTPGFMANEVYPFAIGAEKHDPIANEFLRTNANPQRPPDILPGTGGNVDANNRADPNDPGVNLTPQERDRWQVLRGTLKDPEYGDLRTALTTVMSDPDYKDAATPDQAKALERTVLAYGKAATAQLLAESTDLQQRYAQRQKDRELAHTPQTTASAAPGVM